MLCLSLFMAQGPVFGHQLTPSATVGDTMDLNAARQYMVSLINRDRAQFGLKPVELDETATTAGQLHSNEMALEKYLSHWDLKGRKPDQRYTEVGGHGAVSENALITQYFRDSETYRLAEQQSFSRRELERMESLFFNETAPNDGHRKNILNPDHNKVGIGLTMVVPGNRIACTQEFVNQYGTFSQVPENHKRGGILSFSGKLPSGVSLFAVELRREEAPAPMTQQALNQTHSYSPPSENVTRFYPPPYISPPGLQLTKTNDGQAFVLDIKSQESWQPGLYYVMVWVKTDDSNQPIVTSSQTVAIN